MKAQKQKPQVGQTPQLTLNPQPKCRCIVCGTDFKSRSYLDTLCDACWAENKMRPYGATRVFGGGTVN